MLKNQTSDEKTTDDNLSVEEFIDQYLGGALSAIFQFSKTDIANCIKLLLKIKENNGRLFLVGVGGSAANCSHAVNDFRKIAGIEAYAPTDNVSELTARTNDDGWETIFVNWLKTSKLNQKDGVLVLSVGGGNLEKNISTNIVEALKFAVEVKASIIGIVSRDGGYTKQVADCCIMVPVIHDDLITAYAESLQGLIWHLLVFSPQLRDIKPY